MSKWMTAVVAVTLAAVAGCGGGSGAGHHGAGLSDRKFNTSDLDAVLTGEPQLESMHQLDPSDAPLKVWQDCARHNEGPKLAEDDYIEYESPDQSLTVELEVAQLSSADQAAQVLKQARKYVQSCHQIPIGLPRPSTVVRKIPVQIPAGASDMLAAEFDGADSRVQYVYVTSGRVLMTVYVSKFDQQANHAVSPDPAGTNALVQQMFAKYAQVHASAPVPM